MRAVIRPSRAGGTVIVPPSKSMAHRALIAASLASSASVIDNLALSEDLQATIDCLHAMGAAVDYSNGTAIITGRVLEHTSEGAILPCRASGSTLRFLIPVVLTTDKCFSFTGDTSLFSRPLSVYETICRSQGLRFDLERDRLTVCGRLSATAYHVPGNISSQFISGLLFALPLLDGNSTICVAPPVESRPYIRMTLQSLSHFGVEADVSGDRILISGRQEYCPTQYTVEGDWSSGAYLAALNLLDGKVSLTGLTSDSMQADAIFPSYYSTLQQGSPTLNLADCPDLGPICMAMAAALNGAVFTGVRRLRLKESDRIAAMLEELSKFGGELVVEADQVRVPSATLHRPTRSLSAHGDHRIAMALSILCTLTGGVIEGAEAVKKSYPSFFRDLRKLGIDCTLLNNEGDDVSLWI